MGMFDYIKCLYPLPLPNDAMELNNTDFNNITYQTKDLENCMDYYEIRKDGTLWQEEYDIIDKSDPNAKGISRIFGMFSKTNERMVPVKNFTGQINFYEYYICDINDKLKNDYWIEYIALFNNGHLVTIQLSKFTAEDNTDRILNAKKIQQQMIDRQVLWNKWYIKYFYRHYDNLINKFFRLWNKCSSKMPKSYKIERWLRPL